MPARRSCVIFCAAPRTEFADATDHGWDGSPAPCSWVCRRRSRGADRCRSSRTPDATLRSTPETVIWGYFAADIPPVLRIKSGQTVKIDTVSHGGVNTGVDPVTFFGRAGIARGPGAARMPWTSTQKVTRPKGASAHILTGPIYIEEAAPGDMLEIRIHRPRAPRPLRRQQLKSRDRRLAGPPHRTDAESHQVRCGARTWRCSPTTSRCHCGRSWASWR